MSYKILDIQEKSFLSKAMNDFLMNNFTTLTPTEELISKLPNELKNDLQIKPYFIWKEMSQHFRDAVLDFDVEASDIFVCSLGKCGSSWMQTIVWLLTHNLNYDAIRTMKRGEQMADFDEILNIKIVQENASKLLANDDTKSLDERTALKISWREIFKHLDTPRVIKSHNPVYFLPNGIWTKGAKVIYIVRNPKDMVVSLYHMLRNFLFADITMDDMVNATINDCACASPYLDHIWNFLQIKHLPNVLIVAYEDVVNDSFATIKKISEFLQCGYNNNQLEELVDFISFKNMKKIKSINREDDIVKMEMLYSKKRLDANFTFLRKGKVGGFHDELNDDQIQKLDNWMKNGFMGTDFQFKFL